MIKIKPFPYQAPLEFACEQALRCALERKSAPESLLAAYLRIAVLFKFPEEPFPPFPHRCPLPLLPGGFFWSLLSFFKTDWWLWKYKSNRPSNIFPDWNNNFYMGWVLERARWSKSCVLIGYKISLPCSLGISPALSHKKRFGSCHTGNTSFIGQEG